MEIINISKDFSRYPGLRFKKTSDHSGEEFREDLLIPALDKGPVSIELDDTVGLGPSFLEEAFGGAVRKGYTLTQVELTLVSKNYKLIQKIWEYIRNASQS